MSNTIRYDSLLVRHLAHELNGTLSGVSVTAVHFERSRQRVVVELLERALTLDVRSGFLGWESVAPASDTGIALPRHAAISSVEKLPDERILAIGFRGGKRQNAAHTLLIELLPNAGNAVALDEHGRVLKALFAKSGSRPQVRGQPFTAPEPLDRLGAGEPISLDQWTQLVESVSASERAAKLVERVAFLSSINADALLQPDATDLSASHQRYRELITSETQPVILPDGQPYPHRLWQKGVAHYPTLIAAIEAASAVQRSGASALERLERNVTREQKKLERLHQELESAAADAQRLRAHADLLLASARKVKRGAVSIELAGFDGAAVTLTLDPARSAMQNANDWYEEARKRDRAAERLPGLIAETERAVRHAQHRLERAEAGELPEVAEPAKPAAKSTQRAPRLPYKQFRTTGGLEVRIGRSSKDNDELTMRHSSPNDIWMHARAVGGAHVVLRWNDPTGNPPKQDMVEAATLAAVNSRARKAGTVPVDWTRKKYVRKQRGAPVGQVMLERAKTIFVQPNEALEEKLRWQE